MMQQEEHRQEIPTIAPRTFTVEHLLGSGGFAAVYCVALETSMAEIPDDSEPLEPEPSVCSASSLSRSFFLSWSNANLNCNSARISLVSTETSSQCTLPFLSVNGAPKKYALKRVKDDVLRNERKRKQATKDLTWEATFLAQLPYHPNIIRLCGLSQDFWTTANDDKRSVTETAVSERFLLLEMLNFTLAELHDTWSFEGKHKTSETDRVEEAGLVGLARALAFLHQHRIIYRDLKPQNIGYTPDGQVRLFDFGLARELPKSKDDWHMTGSAGTFRYMAPEVATKAFYDCSADVYAYGMVLWQVCLVEVPYAKARTMSELQGWVTQGKNRPVDWWIRTAHLRTIVSACLKVDTQRRPSWDEVIQNLQQNS